MKQKLQTKIEFSFNIEDNLELNYDSSITEPKTFKKKISIIKNKKKNVRNNSSLF